MPSIELTSVRVRLAPKPAGQERRFLVADTNEDAEGVFWRTRTSAAFTLGTTERAINHAGAKR